MQKEKVVLPAAVRSAAIDMDRRNGLINLTRRDLCDAVGMPEGSFCHVMGVTFTKFAAGLAAQRLEPPTLHAVARARVNPVLRKERILSAAVEAARGRGYHTVTREAIAEAAGVSVGLVSYHFATMARLRRDIVRYAVQHEILEVIAQGLAMRDDDARKASDDLKRRAAALLAC